MTLFSVIFDVLNFSPVLSALDYLDLAAVFLVLVFFSSFSYCYFFPF